MERTNFDKGFLWARPVEKSVESVNNCMHISVNSQLWKPNSVNRRKFCRTFWEKK